MYLLLLATGLIGYFVLHSLLADQGIKAFLTRRLIPTRYYRLIYNLLAIILLLPLAVYYWSIDEVFLFRIVVLKYFGIFFLVAGAVLFLIALRQYNLGAFMGTQQLSGKNDFQDTLQTGGLHRYVRHPLYFAGLLLLWGWFLFEPTDTYLVVAVISTVYLYIGTKLEEQKLAETFGEAYRQYQKEVPMLVPFPKKKHRS